MSRENTRNRRFALQANRLLLRVARNWLGIATVILGVYVTLPWVAPTLMHLGLRGPSEVLYTIYSPFCHQFAFRSFFIFGDQSAYPREVSGTDLAPFEDYAIQSPDFIAAYSAWYAHYHGGALPDMVTEGDLQEFTPWLQFGARDFRGSETMGYKTTLCERDIAIYTAIFVGAILFRRVRYRLRPVPLLLYAFLGLGPIALDGLSQMLGYPPFNFWPPRETLPIFRVITGAIFGLMNVWLGFPYLEMSFRETREQIEAKFRRAGIEIQSRPPA
ncbi:MAG: DUF2085 domain-containing protein [Anaerolineae bacterium]|nr:DUF2085 domain-containing protein [Anaerolineae bacterium]